MSNKETDEEYWDRLSNDRAEAVSRRYGGDLPMGSEELSILMNQLSEEQIQDCLDQYYDEPGEYIY